MSQVVITYEKLFEIARLEKQRAELQKLDENFFGHVLQYINQKKEVFDKSVDESNIFVGGEREKNRILLENVKRILKDLYDRREKKILEMSINESRTGSNLDITKHMLPAEVELYNTVTTQLSLKRKDTLWRLLNGMIPIGSQEIHNVPSNSPETPQNDEEGTDEQIDDNIEQSLVPKTPKFEEHRAPKTTFEPQALKTDENPVESGLKIQLLEEVDQIVGPDLQIYGPYQKDAITAVPNELANALIKTGKAKRAES